ncbi:MAG: hypothetical protein AAB091_01935 [Elusimicrobiota bacterium]
MKRAIGLAFFASLTLFALAALPLWGQDPGGVHTRIQQVFHGRSAQPVLIGPLNLGQIKISGPASRPPLLSPSFQSLVSKLATSAAKIEALWPGYKVFDKPILLNTPGETAILIAMADPPDGYLRYPAPSAPRVPVYILNGGISNAPYMDFDYQINGQSAFLYRVESGAGADETFATVVHERFHGFQDSWKSSSGGNQNYPVLDEVNLALAALEQRTLADALGATAWPQRLEKTKNFIAIRQARYQRLSQEAQNAEAWQERNEGTARFVELEALETAFYQNPRTKLSMELQKELHFNMMKKWRYYITGAAQCYLLDGLVAGQWRKKIQQGQNPWQALSVAWPLSEIESQNRLNLAKSQYQYDILLAEAQQKIQTYTTSRDEAMNEFKNAPGRRLRLMPKKVSGFNISKSELYDDLPEGWLIKGGDFEIGGPGYALSASGRIILLRNMSNPETNLVGDGTIFLDGKPLVLTDGSWAFQNLKIEENGFKLDADIPGSLAVEGNEVSVRFTNQAP